MKINLTGDTSMVLAGTKLLQKELGFELSDSGKEFRLVQHAINELRVMEKDGCVFIYFQEVVQYFRGLATYLQQIRTAVQEVPQFATCGVMIDCSRNAVPKVSSLKFMIRKMAMLGLNTLLLYLEDTYDIKEAPYFGYMRGRFSQEELRECDDYAALFDIEVIPCIQTLGHLKEALKWDYANQIKDTEDILLVNEPQTYQFIEQMLKTISQTFRSNKVHIGMDEAHQIGLGKFLEKNGFQNRFDLMNQHLKQVIALCQTYKIEPMIWSDMYFRLGTNGRYYVPDVVFPREVLADLPEVKMVYWDYYHNESAHYEQMIEKHRELSAELVFAGGIWTWNGMVPNYGKTINTTNAALSACKKTGVQDVFATVWGDNGAETPFVSIFPGLVLYAEHCYKVAIDWQELKERFSANFQVSWEDYLLLKEFDEVPTIEQDNPYESSPSKFLLWQDVLLGLFDETIAGLNLTSHYEKLYDKLARVSVTTPEQTRYFHYYQQFAKVLMLKAEMGLRVQHAYLHKNHEEVKGLQMEIKNLMIEVEELRKYHRELWLFVNKPFGWEVMDLRYSGLVGRLETAVFRLGQWLSGEVDELAELEEERLPFNNPDSMREGTLGGTVYHRIVSVSPLF